MNIYTVMLIIATVNVAIAMFLLWSELKDYGEFPLYYKTQRGGGTSQVVMPLQDFRA